MELRHLRCFIAVAEAGSLTDAVPTIDVALGYNRSNTSPILKLFLSRLDDLMRPSKKD